MDRDTVLAQRAEVQAQLDTAEKQWRDLGEQHRDLLAQGTDGDWAKPTDASKAMSLLQERDDVSVRKNRLRARLDAMPVPREPVSGKFSVDNLSAFERFSVFGKAKLSASEVKDHCDGFQGPTYFGRAEGFVLDLGERDRIQAQTTPAGAVSPIQQPGLVNRLEFYGDVAAVCRQEMTPYGTEMRITNLDDKDNEGEVIAPGASATENDLTQFTSTPMYQSRVTSQAMDVHRYTERDVQGFSVSAEVERAAYRRIGRALNKALTTGDGANNSPLGVVTAAHPSAKTASSTVFTVAEMTGLRYEIDRAYWNIGPEGRYGYVADTGRGMLGYMVSHLAEKALVLLEDTQKRPLYLPSVRDGVPDTWNGFPIVVNGNMAAPAASAKPVLFGNFSYYAVRFIDRLEFWRFFDSGNALADTVRYLANTWADGSPVGARTDNLQGARNTIRFEAVAALDMKA